jgi:uncharacterized membrane protein
MAWLRRRLITGFFVTVPLVAAVAALVWMVRAIERLTGWLPARLFGSYAPEFPGMGIALTLVMVLVVGIVATNMFGQRLLGQIEGLLMHVPVFRTIYGPLKQLTDAFSPNSEAGFKRVVLVEQGSLGRVLGFLTKEFVVEHDGRPETLLAVYIPTNHLYLGSVVICPAERVSYPDLTVEQGIRIFLTGGMALPSNIESRTDAPPS